MNNFGKTDDTSDPLAPQIIKRFAVNSSIHGINYIVTTKLKLCRVFWVLACIAASVSFGGQLVTLINKYLSNPTKTTVEVTREPADFPDVTICPLRNFDISVVRSLYAQLSLSGSVPQALKLNLTRAEPEFEIPYLRKMEPYYNLWAKYYATNATLFGLAMTRSNMFSNFELDILKKAMIPQWELALRCKYQGIQCREDLISTFYDPYFFRCLTIHASNESSLSEGVESGLAILGIYGSNMVDWNGFNSTTEHTDSCRWYPGVQSSIVRRSRSQSRDSPSGIQTHSFRRRLQCPSGFFWLLWYKYSENNKPWRTIW